MCRLPGHTSDQSSGATVDARLPARRGDHQIIRRNSLLLGPNRADEGRRKVQVIAHVAFCPQDLDRFLNRYRRRPE